MKRESIQDPYAERCLTIVRNDMSATAPEFVRDVEFETISCGTGLVNVELSFSLVAVLRQEELGHQERSQFPESSDLGEIDRQLTHAAQARILALSSSPLVDASAGYPTVPPEIVVADRALSLVYRHACESCAGKKAIACVACKGTGGTKCLKCESQGDLQCHECHGAGVTGHDRERCRTCHGNRRITCASCEGRKVVACKVCKGKRKLKCEPCVATGFQRKLRWSSVTATPEFVAKTIEGPASVIGPALESFGTVRNINPGFGVCKVLERKGSRLVFQFKVPFCVFTASYAGATSTISCAGVAAKLIESGDFLEAALAQTFGALQEKVGTSSAFHCDQAQLRVALNTFLKLTPHQAALAFPDRPIHGMSRSYAARSRELVSAGLKVLRGNLMFVRLSTFGVLAPVVHVFMNRVFGMSFGNSLPWLAAILGCVWLSVEISQRITVASLAATPEVKTALLNLP